MTSCFNPRSRTGSDLAITFILSFDFCFNPRSRTGSDVGDPTVSTGDGVSIHAPVQGATYKLDKAKKDWEFQSTLPYRERPPRSSWTGYQHKFQSTLPYRERLPNPYQPRKVFQVSIHAPVQGATIINSRVCSCSRSFNPRSRTGSDSLPFEPLLGKGFEARKCESPFWK